MLACAPHEPMLVILYMLCSSTPRSRKSQAAQCPQKEKQGGLQIFRRIMSWVAHGKEGCAEVVTAVATFAGSLHAVRALLVAYLVTSGGMYTLTHVAVQLRDEREDSSVGVQEIRWRKNCELTEEATVKMKRGALSGAREVIYGPFDRGLLCQMIPKVVTFMDHFLQHLTEETSVKWSKKW